jgi:hypothetical protein
MRPRNQPRDIRLLASAKGAVKLSGCSRCLVRDGLLCTPDSRGIGGRRRIKNLRACRNTRGTDGNARGSDIERGCGGDSLSTKRAGLSCSAGHGVGPSFGFSGVRKTGAVEMGGHQPRLAAATAANSKGPIHYMPGCRFSSIFIFRGTGLMRARKVRDESRRCHDMSGNLLTNRVTFARIGPINRSRKDQGMSLMHYQLHISANKQDKRSKKPAERSG